MSVTLSVIQLLICLVSVLMENIEKDFIYHIDNTYPFIDSFNPKMTIAVSSNPVHKTVIDEHGNIIQNKTLTLFFESIRISGFIVLNSNGLYLIATSNGANNYLHSFNDDKAYDSISFTNSQLISLSLTLLMTNNILLSYITNDQQLYVALYQLNSNFEFNHLNEAYIAGNCNQAISCIEIIMSNGSVELCLFSITSKDYLIKLDNKLESQLTVNTVIDQSNTNISFNKIIKLQNSYFAFCSLKTSLSCIYGVANEDDIIINKDNSVPVFHNCNQNTKSFDIVHYKSFQFYAVCDLVKNNIVYMKLSKLIIDTTTKKLTIAISLDIQISNGNNVSSFSISRLGLNFVSLFYHDNNKNVFRPIDYPSCENHNLKVIALKGSTPIIIQSEIINQFENSEEALFEFTHLPNEGLLKFSNGTIVEKNTHYVKGEVVYLPMTEERHQRAEYRGISPLGEGKTCQIEFDIIHCYEGCSDCLTEGNSESNNCIGDCNINYFPVIDRSSECRKEADPPYGYYLDKIESLFIWKHCFGSCEECFNKAPTENDNQCIKCKDKHYKIELTTNCVRSAPLSHYSDTDENGITIFRQCYHSCSICNTGATSISHNCISCNSDYYQIEGTMNCYPPPRIGYYLDKSIDPPLFKACNSKCKQCDSNPNQCTECNEGYYMDFYVNNCVRDCGNAQYLEGDKCLSQCSFNLGVLLKRCINCKHADHYNYNGQCINQLPPKTFISNKEYNLIEDCDHSCRICEDNSFNCLQCESEYYSEENSCVNACNKGKYYEDSLNKQCINCKSLYPPKYKWENENECIDYPLQAFVSNSAFNIIKACHEHCLSCLKEANDTNHNCITCQKDMLIHPRKKGYCVKQCNLINSTWYIDNNTNEHKCTEETDCENAQGGYVINDTRECVFDCKALSLYEYKNICYSQCPNNSIGDISSLKCFDMTICKSSSITPPSSITDFNSVRSSLDLIASDYIVQNQMTIDQVGWFTLKDCNVRMFNLDECNYNFTFDLIANAEQLTRSAIPIDFSYFNITECQIKLKVAYNLNRISDIVVVMIDSMRTNNLFYQLDYFFYSSVTRERLDLAYCKEILNTVLYPLNITEDKLAFASEMSLKGVDLFNPIDPFFNNHCFSYCTSQGRDVIIKDRRNDFFLNATLCEPGCKYVRIDYSHSKSDCLCEMKPYFNEAPNDFEWLSFDNNNTSHNVMVCFSNIFNIENYAHNYGSWIFFILFASSFISAVLFFWKGISPICLFLDNYCFRKIGSNQPKNGTKSKKKAENKTTIKNNPKHNKRISKSNSNKQSSSQSENDSSSAKSMTKLTSGVELSKNEAESNNNSELCQIRIDNSKEINNIQKKHNRISLKKYNKASRQDQLVKESLDDLSFKDAIDKDNRPFHFLFFNYCTKLLFGLNLCTNYSIFEPLSLKIASLSLYLSLVLILNIFQYNEKYISTRYHSEHELINDEVIQSSVVGLISSALGLIITYSLSFRKRFMTLVKLEDLTKYNEQKEKVLFKFKGGVGAILVVNILLSGFFWFYASSFCSVYNKTKIRWLMCSSISLGISLIIQLVLAIIVTLLRFISIKYSNRCCYNISQLLF